jgi:hypothetical protein
MYRPKIACITETWLNTSSSLASYSIPGYFSCFNNRRAKAGGGVMMLINSDLASSQLSPEVTDNDAYNVCAVSVGCNSQQLLVVTVYRAP